MHLATSSVRSLLVVRPGAPSSILAPSSDAPCYVRSLLVTSHGLQLNGDGL